MDTGITNVGAGMISEIYRNDEQGSRGGNDEGVVEMTKDGQRLEVRGNRPRLLISRHQARNTIIHDVAHVFLLF